METQEQRKREIYYYERDNGEGSHPFYCDEDAIHYLTYFQDLMIIYIEGDEVDKETGIRYMRTVWKRDKK